MSLYSAMSAGVSALGAQGAAMATVADNIGNVNTVGYKGTRADFNSMVATVGRGASYVAGGVSVVPRAMVSVAGAINSGARSTDLAINGGGFFVVKTSATGNQVAYTRAGAFAVDREGYLQNSAGLYLQGWQLDKKGNLKGGGSLDSLETVRPNLLSGEAEASTKLDLQMNLDSRTTAYTGAYADGDLAAGTIPSSYTRPVTVYDAQGNGHVVNFSYLKTDANTWKVEVYVNPKSDIDGGVAKLASGEIKFDGTGAFDSTTLPASVTPKWANKAGSNPIQLSLGTKGNRDGIMQLAQDFTAYTNQADGGLLGDYQSVEVSKTGTVTAIFANGARRDIYQLPLASFRNPDGLARISGTAFQASQDSGAPSINVASANGNQVWGGRLEGSTTDLAQEFSDMIRFQRAYSASSKIITTVDEMLQEVSNLKR